MKRRPFLVLVMFVALAALPAAAQSTNNNVVVRDTNGLGGIQNSCVSVGCDVVAQLDGSQGQLFLVSPTQTSGGGGGGGGGGLLGGVLGGLVNVAFNLFDFVAKLLLQPGVTNAEPDRLLMVQAMTLTAPSGLWDTTPVNYYGNTVWDGYVHQPAAFIIDVAETQSSFRVTGSGTVAVIDTGIDPTHPAFRGVLVPGYDFTRNTAGGSELGDVQQSTMAVVNRGGSPAQVNQSTMAVVNPWDAMTFQSSEYAAYGHGTMTSGIVHLVAPTAKIMPLKAFRADGTGYLSDVLRATYYAVQHSAKVINMSFDFMSYSLEMDRAVSYANRAGVICVASAGNDGQDRLVYPAAYTSSVMGVASTTDYDQRSSFSNYGQDLVWVAAPGEGIISPYPQGTYGAGWGTSFSAPFVSGAAALLRSVDPGTNQYRASQALAHAQYISSELNHGRINLYWAVSSMSSGVPTSW